MIETLVSILLIVAAMIVVAIPLFIYAWIRTIPLGREIRRFAEFASTRRKLSDLEFYQRAELSNLDLPLIKNLREGLGKMINVDSEFIYPEDELRAYGFQYDDCVSGFVQRCGLIAKDPYWFPMEKGSTVRDVFPWVHQINNEQVIGGNGGQRQ